MVTEYCEHCGTVASQLGLEDGTAWCLLCAHDNGHVTDDALRLLGRMSQALKRTNILMKPKRKKGKK